MPFAHTSPVSSHLSECATCSGFKSSRRSVRGYGSSISAFESLACKGLPCLRAGVSRAEKPRKALQKLISRDSPGCPDKGDECRYHRRDGGRTQAFAHRSKSFRCSSHFADAGYSDTQSYLPLLEDAYEKSLFSVASSKVYYTPHPEALDPISQLLYQHAMGRNLQWWRFLSHCRAQVDSALLHRRRYALISKSYTKVLLPTAGGGAFAVPAISLPSKQDPLSSLLDNMNLLVNEYFGWVAQMGDRYGSSLLCLLVLGYCVQGFRCFPWMAVSFYLKDGLAVDPAMLQFLQSTVTLPMVAKPLYGIISDVIYIGGERRMPYLMFAGALQVLSWSAIALSSGVRSAVGPLIGVLLVSNVGAAIAEVVNDALVAESVQKERGRAKGELQSFVWLALAIGGMVGNFTGGLALVRMSSTTMFAIFAVFAAGHLWVSSVVKERYFTFKSSRPRKSRNSTNSMGAFNVLSLQAGKLIDLVSRRDIALPLAWFAASYAVIPAMGGSIFFYQAQYLNIHPTYLGLAKVMGQMGLLAGSLLYNHYLKGSSPRKVLMAVQVLLSACMLSDILLVSRMNLRLGIPDQLFVLGASAFVEAIAQFKVLPFSVLLTQRCPAGSEGSLLAFFMSCHCLAAILSGYAGTFVASLLHISADNFVGLPLGILIQSVAALIPLFWISCIPDTAHKVSIA